MKTVTIIRGISNSGKSTYAQFLKSLNPDKSEICCADDFFENENGYKFDVTKLDEAHNECFEKFKHLLDSEDIEHIIVANTSTAMKEFGRYKELAEEKGIMVHTIIKERFHKNTNHHNVPKETIKHQLNKLLDSFKNWEVC